MFLDTDDTVRQSNVDLYTQTGEGGAAEFTQNARSVTVTVKITK